MPARNSPRSLAIALGGNIGDPELTLGAVRPLLEGILRAWWAPRQVVEPAAPPRLRWSPLFRTEAVGGPAGQPAFVNAVLLAEPLPPEGSLDPVALLRRLQALETRFGRQRHEPWGPRTLDLDLLWCGDGRLSTAELQLPHPRLLERSFVLAPLAAIDADLTLPSPDAATHPLRCAHQLAALLPRLAEAPPERLPPRPDWPE